ncbi:hypothetical protein INT47_003213 [Mucor saturninus]|uniref:Fanconi-associated nuclease n=1 Tax=Mucor saturninus TaxID=64648 RepID=A0A8H7RGL2_9FUNG|nr:hypothetical protein INT47_003213 [Mucor saturninus]
MQNSNKRKNSLEPATRTKAQRSIANFFGHTKEEDVQPKEEENVKDVQLLIKTNEEGTVKDVETKAEEHSKADFYDNSMYTDEFNLMLETVLKGESFLFNEQEKQTFDRFKSLKGESKHLLVRLLMRKPGWIRSNKLKYQNYISNVAFAISELQQLGFLKTALTDLDEATQLLSRDELQDILKERNIVLPVDKRKKDDFRKALMVFGLRTSGNIATHYSVIDPTDEAKTSKLWSSIEERLGTCIQVEPHIYKLFQLLQVVYYRINKALDTSAMSTSILAKTSKRIYPLYTSCRSDMVWNSRDDLLRYEEALSVEKEYETSVELLTVYNSAKTKKFISAENGDLKVRELMIKCWTICEDRIGMWDECILQEEQLEEELMRPYYMRRFEADHGTALLAKLHEYELEAIILQKLIDQKLYRLGKRGKWYDRLALVQSKYLNKDQVRVQKKLALKTCIDAIHDPKVHQIYMHKIHKRINQLERDLCIPRREQHNFDYMTLKKPETRTIYGERLSDEVIGKKSVWRSDNGAECSVEHVAIEYYQKQGFKGLHCENGIVKMIAVLLFWDIIFAPMTGVFETPYQMAPLDLGSDAFYEARLDIINVRLREISEGHYKDIILKVDERERARGTVCIGTNWDYEQQDILEIAECIGASSLASLCQLYFEEFGHRQGGMPDLCCWDYEKRKCLFSEVKGPGDTLSETQKMWIETLTGFSIQVEVCYVKEWKGEDIFLK